MDNDRYVVDGEQRQVMLSARELSYQNLPRDVQGRDADLLWINEHLQYTHGYGAVVGPVNRITTEGLPELWVKDIPPASTKSSLRITRPEIYYGEVSNEYVFVRTRSQEIDYPSGDENVYTTYQGQGGVQVGSLWRRLLLSIRFGSYRILLSPEITSDSRVLFHRQIGERVRRIAPFFRFDADPYFVIRADGRLAWLLDGYTVTDRYPYAERVPGLGNYVRNSVKVVVDAYDGTVRFYVSDAQDPIVRAYAAHFPGLLEPIEAMPADLRAHVRYPAGFFAIQARMYATYHMQDPQGLLQQGRPVVRGAHDRGRPRPRARPLLHDHAHPRRIARGVRPADALHASPPGQHDRVAGRALRRSRLRAPGRVPVPQAASRLRPRQISARIDQDAVISQQLTLWSQRGSTVIRGSLLASPWRTRSSTSSRSTWPRRRARFRSSSA